VSKVCWEASDEGGNYEQGGDESGKLESQWIRPSHIKNRRINAVQMETRGFMKEMDQ